MTDAEQRPFDGRVRHYADILNELFNPTFNNNVNWLFEFVCTMVRAAGMQGPDWDSYYESEAVLADLHNLSLIELPTSEFPDVKLTRVRLALISYCHVTEMDLPYTARISVLRCFKSSFASSSFPPASGSSNHLSKSPRCRESFTMPHTTRNTSG